MGKSKVPASKRAMINLREMDRNTANYAFNLVADSMRRKLSKEEVQEIYNQGLPISFRRGAPLNAIEQNYTLSYHPEKGDTPRLKADCFFSTSGHREIMDKGSPIVAGTLTKGKFDSYSSTWMKKASCGTPAYNFGEAVNKAMLDHFKLK